VTRREASLISGFTAQDVKWPLWIGTGETRTTPVNGLRTHIDEDRRLQRYQLISVADLLDHLPGEGPRGSRHMGR